jgi:type I restriction-modification system DNA methylase subunit
MGDSRYIYHRLFGGIWRATNLGFEAKLWQAANARRNNMDAAEYKHVVLGLIFLKDISDAFEEQHPYEVETQTRSSFNEVVLSMQTLVQALC